MNISSLRDVIRTASPALWDKHGKRLRISYTCNSPTDWKRLTKYYFNWNSDSDIKKKICKIVVANVQTAVNYPSTYIIPIRLSKIYINWFSCKIVSHEQARAHLPPPWRWPSVTGRGPRGERGRTVGRLVEPLFFFFWFLMEGCQLVIGSNSGRRGPEYGRGKSWPKQRKIKFSILN